jgi:hypothetical protein
MCDVFPASRSATVTIIASSTPTEGEIPWTASSFADIAGNVGSSGQCANWLPGCAAVGTVTNCRESNLLFDYSYGL